MTTADKCGSNYYASIDKRSVTYNGEFVSGKMTNCVSEECDENDDNDDVDNTGLPYPAFMPKVFFCMSQDTIPRKWLLRLVTWPYPFTIAYSKL